jgi:hypothetical protein
VVREATEKHDPEAFSASLGFPENLLHLLAMPPQFGQPEPQPLP